ncbi:VOC family protein [uncultured Ornithinimicrobium sp.]|jgi:catechol 2,3-dioxygenase-like lactoylglutathione lyase family enzyme|uniref:VOC family protein n=1 Tax=uncultured Ornithinimicrobium sp. TaxID=259307 RepID=UPI0025919F97|nr:VOC family protein [uncultured Ornithinimicrobium sp.]
MIAALHTLVYSDDPVATRAFFRDVLQLPYVRDDVPEGQPEWLIFRTGPSELGVHPTSGPGGFEVPRHHAISFMCDDLAATMAELAARGAEFATEPVERRFGTEVWLRVPGADDMMLYQPTHEVAHDLPPAE